MAIQPSTRADATSGLEGNYLGGAVSPPPGLRTASLVCPPK